jgi:hypothetical protein
VSEHGERQPPDDARESSAIHGRLDR